MEWTLLLAVIVVVCTLFVRQARVVQGQGELAAVKTTLAALRTALVVDHLQKHAQAGVAAKQPNPFELLGRRPLNYFGEISQAQVATAPAGTWVFDSACGCVGYLPIDNQWFDSPSGDFVAWFQLNGAPGPQQLTAREAYLWQSQVLN